MRKTIVVPGTRAARKAPGQASMRGEKVEEIQPARNGVRILKIHGEGTYTAFSLGSSRLVPTLPQRKEPGRRTGSY